jgi:tetratricopeptide (TPR) repeat protein
VAGERDEFVTRTSSLDPFPIKQQAVIPGNHLEIINPSSIGDLKIQVLLKHLAGDTAPAGPWNSARIAVESRQFHQAILLLEPNQSGLDEDAIVTLALAYEGMDRGDDALALLEAHGGNSTDAMGTLAGRLKRRWLVYRQKAAAERALQLYSDAFTLSQKSINLAQAFYHGINIAFMYLAYRKDGEQAKIIASKVLDFSRQAPQEKWALATQGEALLILENTPLALDCYRQAVALKPELRELQSMYAQAITISKLKNLGIESDLNNIFEGSSS